MVQPTIDAITLQDNIKNNTPYNFSILSDSIIFRASSKSSRFLLFISGTTSVAILGLFIWLLIFHYCSSRVYFFSATNIIA